MKKNSLLLFLFISVNLFAQLQVNTVTVTSNDLVYDNVTDKIYVSIPSANGANGNSIGIINPNTYSLENTIFIGSDPTILAISDDGQYIYSGFSGTSTVRRFNITTLTPEIQFTLGNDTSTGANYAEDIEVMPGQPNTIAVSRKNNGFSPRHEGVAIYDDGIARATTTPDHTGSNKIEFTSSNSLIGYNNETTEFGIRRLSINANGVANISVSQNVLSGFYLDFIYHNNKMYATNGKVIDITTTPFVSGQFTNTSGPVVFDTYYNRVCFASTDGSGNITFKRFNPSTFLLVDNLNISQAFGTPKSIITCGNGCYAFNTDDNKVVIIKDATLNTDVILSDSKISIYPNPTSDNVTIESENDIVEISIFDINGRKINNINFNTNKIFLEELNTGIYLAKIKDNNGNISIEKIIKK